MSNSNDTEPDIKFLSRPAKQTPPGYQIKLTQAQGLAIAKIVSDPGWKVLKNTFVAQRKDHIARQSLSTSHTPEQMEFYRGATAELQLFFLTIERIKKAALKEEGEPDKDDF